MEKETPFLAFSYMFKDNKFWTKYLTLFILTFLALLPSVLNENAGQLNINQALLFFPALIGFFVNILYYGYLAAGIKSLSEQNSNYILPFFNFTKNGLLGLKCLAGTLLFCIIFSIPILIIFIICLIMLKAGTVLPIILFCVTFYLAIALLFPAFFRMFAITQETLAFFKLKTIFKSIFFDIKRYLAYVATFVLAVIIFVIAICILTALLPSKQFISSLLMCLLITAFGTYLNMVLMYITAKCIN